MRFRTGAILFVTAAVLLFGYWYLDSHSASVPKRALRIGFENNPPVQTRTASGFSGLAVETVNEAARRAGIQLQWVETGYTSYESFQRGLVDLWPLMVDLPEREKLVYFARPWMHSRYTLLVREESPVNPETLTKTVAVLNVPIHVRMVQEAFPKAHLDEKKNIADLVKSVCENRAAGAFLEGRAAFAELRESPPECAGVLLRVQKLPNMAFHAGVASTHEVAAAADKLQTEIDSMFRDGSLAVLITKYSYFGLDDTWASYEMLAEAQRTRWLAWAFSALVIAMALTLWQASSLRERKRQESALRESEERFRNLANRAPVMIVASGPDKNATFFNKIWLDFTGRTMLQELGKGWVESIHPEDRASAMESYAASFESRSECNLEYRLRRADGEYRHIMCSGVPHFDPSGQFGGYIASCIDLTDIRNAQEEARERHNLESLGVLAGGIAHDFNNLLGGALAYTELAQQKVAEARQPDEELQQIRGLAIRGAEIVRQLMIFAGKESGSFEAVDLSSVVSEMLELLKVSISKHAVLKTNLREGLPAVRGNAVQIRQVVMNLVTNASEAIGERDGVIQVLTESVRIHDTNGSGDHLPAGEYLRLEVSDTGHGMTPETQKRLFDPFFTTKFAGRGMGLAVVHRIVQKHGGSIQVVSAIGRGTSVQVLLPCTEGVANITAPAAPQVSATSVPAEGTILVVEDEFALRSAVSKMLQRNGFRVIQASDGSAALELIRTQHQEIDVMLLDVTLPGVSSREVFEEARTLCPEIQVILTSAYSQESLGATLPGFGAAHFIRKPFHISDLMSLLRETLSA